MEFKTEPKFIENPIEKINQLISDLKLKTSDLVQYALVKKWHTFRAKCQDQSGQEFFLKVRLWDENLIRQTLKNELRNSLLFCQKKYSKYLKTHRPIKWNLDGKFDWILFEYLPGKFLIEDWQKIDIFEKICQIFLSIQKIPLEILPSETRKFDAKLAEIFAPQILPQDSLFDRFRKLAEVFIKAIEVDIPAKKILAEIDQNQDLFSKAKLVLIYGDPALDNILIFQNQIFLTDFEYLRPYLAPSDFVSIFNWAFDKPDWRKKFVLTAINKIKNPQEFEILFRLILILRTLHDMVYFSKTKPGLYPVRKKYFEFNQKTIPRALDSFESLLEKY